FLLHTPRVDLGKDQLVRVAAVDLVDDLETGRDLAGLAELADHLAVDFRLVDFTRVLPRPWWIAVRVRVGEEDVLMRSRRDAQRPSGAEIGDLSDRLQIVIELLVAVVGPVGHPDMPALVDLEAGRQIELSRLVAGLFTADLGDEAAVLVVLHDAVVAVAVRNEDVALRIEADVGGAAQDVLLRGRVRTGGGNNKAGDERGAGAANP